MDLQRVLRDNRGVDVYGEWDYYDPAGFASRGHSNWSEVLQPRLIDRRYPYDNTSHDDEEQARPYRLLSPRGGVQATPQFNDQERAHDLVDTWQAEHERMRSPRGQKGLPPVPRETIDDEYYDWPNWLDPSYADLRSNIRRWRRDWQDSGMRDDWVNPAGHGEPFAMGDYGTLRAPDELPPYDEDEERRITHYHAPWRREIAARRREAEQDQQSQEAINRALREYSHRQGYGGEVFGQAGPAYGQAGPAYGPAYHPVDPEAGRIYDWPQTPDQFMGFADNGHDDMFDDFGHMDFGGL